MSVANASVPYGYQVVDQKMAPPFWIKKYEKEARKFWDTFYKRNTTHFFKDRQWFWHEFPELLATCGCAPHPEAVAAAAAAAAAGKPPPADIVAAVACTSEISSDGSKDSSKECSRDDGEGSGVGMPCSQPPVVVVEVGCGVGNSLFPLLDLNPHLYFYSSDFAPRAVALVKENERFDERRCHAFVCDIVHDNLCAPASLSAPASEMLAGAAEGATTTTAAAAAAATAAASSSLVTPSTSAQETSAPLASTALSTSTVPPSTPVKAAAPEAASAAASTSAVAPGCVPIACADLAMMIFVLSAIASEHHLSVMRKIFQALKPGGMLLFRDYGLNDMAQIRFEQSLGKKLADNFYVRKDGTRAYYFGEEEMQRLAVESGFEVVENQFVLREVVNHKEKLEMHRIFLQGKYRKPLQP